MFIPVLESFLTLIAVSDRSLCFIGATLNEFAFHHSFTYDVIFLWFMTHACLENARMFACSLLSDRECRRNKRLVRQRSNSQT